MSYVLEMFLALSDSWKNFVFHPKQALLVLSLSKTPSLLAEVSLRTLWETSASREQNSQRHAQKFIGVPIHD